MPTSRARPAGRDGNGARAMKLFLAFAAIAVTLAAFYLILFSGLQGAAKAVLAVVLLAACSLSLQRLLGLEGELGLLLFRTRRGLGFLDRVARKAPGLWVFLADIGLVAGFGLFSLFIFQKKIPKTTVVAGMVFLLVFWAAIFPFVAPLSLELINLSGIEKDLLSGSEVAATPGDPLGMVLSYILLLEAMVPVLLVMSGGLAFLLAYYVVFNAVDILMKMGISAFALATGASGGNAASTALPGVSPILPGINIPLVEGVLALALILVFHEGAHAVLARVARIPLKSAGIVFFGILPFGAFVDPDEEKLAKMDRDPQNRVLVAGSTANIYAATAFFFVFLAFYFLVLAGFPSPLLGTRYVQVDAVAENGTAYGIVPAGAVIAQWNGVNVTTIGSLASAVGSTGNASRIDILARNGTLFTAARGNRTANASLLPTQYGDYLEPGTGLQVSERNYGFVAFVNALSADKPYVGFLFNFIGLAFVLNVLVGMVNLLPIPPFDGYRILSLTLGEKSLYRSLTVTKAVVVLVVVAFIVNALPWLWR